MRSSRGSNNNNRSSILALFLDAPTTDAPLTLPSVRPATQTRTHLSAARSSNDATPPNPHARDSDTLGFARRADSRPRQLRRGRCRPAAPPASSAPPTPPTPSVDSAMASSMAAASAATGERLRRRHVPRGMVLRHFAMMENQNYGAVGS